MEEENAMSVDKLLNNLQKVKRTGEGKWIACCPAHQDRTASLAVTDNGDGRILINCFAGCDTYSILRSVGLEWADVMPEKSITNNEKPVKQIIYASDALRIIRFESQVMLAIAYDITKSGIADIEMIKRMQRSMQIINKAYEASNVGIK